MSIISYELDCQLDAWLQGIYSEIEFWNKYIGQKGWIYKAGWEKTTDRERRFVLESDIPNDMWGKDFNFIDVGSGPFSRCGFVTDKVKLHHCAVDPLAIVYTILKKKYGVDNGVNLRTGFVELLDKTFSANSFDLVHMSNSLDHSFSPIMGIYQLINICRIGGKVILRHKQNEALTGQYGGLHQWNLLVDINNNSFVIWRNSERYSVNDMFSEFVDIKCLKDPVEEIFYRVEMIKRKDIDVPANDIYDIMLEKIYHYMLSVILNDVLKNVNSPKTIFIEKQIDKLNNTTDEELAEYFSKKGWNRISIYGLGTIGMNLLDRLKSIGSEIVEIIDQREIEYKGWKTVNLQDRNIDKHSDVVIVTSFSGFDMIRESIVKSGSDREVISIEALME